MISRFTLLVYISFLFSGCHDSIDGFLVDPLFPNQETFKSSLFIEVFDSQKRPVLDAIVTIGNIQKETNEDGFLYMADISLSESSYLTVRKDGFFTASRRFYPQYDKSQYVKLILLPESRSAFFNATTGGQMELEHLTIDFPKDGYTFENGESYHGVVVVSAQTIQADDPDLSFKMPGNLLGISGNGSMASLASFGMFVVNLKSNEGEKLQLKNGSEAGIQMKIPTAILSTAPATIPMWHFDEAEGIWKEEGSAVLSDDAYMAQVKHFSFWNCDYPFLATKWKATIAYDDGTPGAQLKVCLTNTDLNVTNCGYTNESGQTSGFIPSNSPFHMEIMNACGEIIFTNAIGPFSDSVVSSLITVPKQGLKMSTIIGTAESCDGMGVKNLYAKISVGSNLYYQSFSDRQGEFSIDFVNCNDRDVTLTLLDKDHLKYNSPQTFSSAEVIDVGKIKICDNLLEYAIIELDSFPEYVIFNEVEYGHGGDGYFFNASDSIQNNFFIGTKKASAGHYSNASCRITVHLFPESVLSAGTCDLIITHFGKPGEPIQGTFRGNFENWGQIQNDPRSAFSGSFSVIRK